MPRDPGDGQRGGIGAAFPCQCRQIGGRPVHALETVAFRIAVVFGQPARGVAGILAGQKPATERRIGHRQDAFGGAHRQDLDLGLSLHEVVHRLDRVDAGAETRRDGLRLRHLPGGEVGDTNMTDAAALLQFGQRLEGFLERDGAVPAVQVEQVGDVHAQPAAALVEAREDVFARGTAGIGDLGRDEEILAHRRREAAEQRFRGAISIDISRVEMADALLHAGVEHRAALVGIGAAAELHGAEGEGRDGLAVQGGELCHDWPWMGRAGPGAACPRTPGSLSCKMKPGRFKRRGQ